MAAVVGLIGAGIGAAQSINQGMSAQAQSKNNAILGEYQAEDVGRAGTADYNRYRQTLRQFLGKQRAIIGANNLQNAGSPEAVQEDAAAAGEQDAANISHDTAMQMYALRVGAKDALYRGVAARNAGIGDAAGSILGGASKTKYFGGYGG